MSNINTVQGFDQRIYDDLLAQYTQSASRTQETLDSQIALAMESGLSFSEAAKNIQSSLPALPQPVAHFDVTSYAAGALPSFGSNYLALITDMTAEQRRQNAEQRALQTEQMIAKIQEQAETIRDKAAIQLAVGITSGLISIGQGVTSVGIGVYGMKSANSAGQAAENAVLGTNPTPEIQAQASAARSNAMQMQSMKINTYTQGVSASIGGLNTIIGAAGQYFATLKDADQKALEGEVEKIRAMQQMLESLDQSLKELIQKALSTQDTIQQNMNQTRTRILG